MVHRRLNGVVLAVTLGLEKGVTTLVTMTEPWSVADSMVRRIIHRTLVIKIIHCLNAMISMMIRRKFDGPSDHPSLDDQNETTLP